MKSVHAMTKLKIFRKSFIPFHERKLECCAYPFKNTNCRYVKSSTEMITKEFNLV